jgi:hypothetical protein
VWQVTETKAPALGCYSTAAIGGGSSPLYAETETPLNKATIKIDISRGCKMLSTRRRAYQEISRRRRRRRRRQTVAGAGSCGGSPCPSSSEAGRSLREGGARGRRGRTVRPRQWTWGLDALRRRRRGVEAAAAALIGRCAGITEPRQVGGLASIVLWAGPNDHGLGFFIYLRRQSRIG